MGKKNDKIHYMNTGAYPVYVGLALSQAAYDKEMRRLKIPSPSQFVSDCANATTHVMDRDTLAQRLILVCIDPEYAARSKGVEVATTIIHESVHVWDFIKEFIGVRNTDTEVNAYNIDWIARFFMDRYAETLA